MTLRHLLLPVLLLWMEIVSAHDHHDISEEDLRKPIDSLLWLHISLQLITWGFIFPTGMVLGLNRHRLHVPLQLLGFLLTAGGYYFGHTHGGRKFLPSAHEKLATVLFLPIFGQFCLGAYLKLHINEGTILRRFAVKAHGILGVSYPLWGWVQMLLGVIALGGYCQEDHLGQCLAHYIMGSSFILYGVVSAIIIQTGTSWLRNTGHSMEYWESWIITLWGAVNTFTEHRGSHWSHKDLQHTSLGILWWVGGALGIWNSRNKKRSMLPALLIALTGWAMSAHSQATITSSKVHTAFGFSLVTAAIVRIVEISAGFKPSLEVLPLQHVPPILLIASGLLFMAATDEELNYIDQVGMDYVTYVLLLFSAAFFIYVILSVLLHLHANTDTNSVAAKQNDMPGYAPLNDLEGRGISIEDSEEEELERIK